MDVLNPQHWSNKGRDILAILFITVLFTIALYTFCLIMNARGWF